MRRHWCGRATGSTTARCSASPTRSTRRSRERVDELARREHPRLPERATARRGRGRSRTASTSTTSTGTSAATTASRATPGLQNYIPCNLGEIRDYYRRFIDPPDMMVIKTCPIDARRLLQLQPAEPLASRDRVAGQGRHRRGDEPACRTSTASTTGCTMSEVDYVIEGDGQPAPELPNPAPTDADRAVARLIAAEIEDGACLQIGIGAMPNAVCSLLLRERRAQPRRAHRDAHRRDHRPLPGRRRHRRAQDAASRQDRLHASASGSQVAVRDDRPTTPTSPAKPSSLTNLPHIIMQNDRLTAINNTTQMDLQGQAASESSGHRHISGTGGQLQFVRGAYASKGGKSFICMSSTYERARRAREPHRARPDAGQHRHRTRAAT